MQKNKQYTFQTCKTSRIIGFYMPMNFSLTIYYLMEQNVHRQYDAQKIYEFNRNITSSFDMI